MNTRICLLAGLAAAAATLVAFAQNPPPPAQPKDPPPAEKPKTRAPEAGQNNNAGDKPEAKSTGKTAQGADPEMPRRRAAGVPTTLQLLNARVPDVKLHDTPLEKVFDWISEITGATMVVKWDRLADAGVARDKPISLTARRMPIRTLLSLILDSAGADSKLAYRASNGMFIISTYDDFAQEELILTYDINDLITVEPRIARMFYGRQHDVVTGVEPVVAAGVVGVRPITEKWLSGVDIESENPFGADAGDGGLDERQQHIRELINIIQTTIEPDSWDINGGKGTIRVFRNQLVIRNNPFVHQQLAGALKKH